MDHLINKMKKGLISIKVFDRGSSPFKGHFRFKVVLKDKIECLVKLINYAFRTNTNSFFSKFRRINF